MNRIAKTIKKTSDTFDRIINSFGRISSIAQDGRKLNVQNTLNSEIRELMIITPYGISSCGLDNLYVQTIVNDNNNNVAVGVFDPNKPACLPGELILYSSGGAYIKLGVDGVITLHGTRIDLNP